MPDPTRISLQDAAERLGVHYMTAYRYVRTGRLPAEQVQGHWWVDPADLSLVARSAGRPGRPPNGRTSSQAASRRRLEDRLVRGDENGAWSVAEAALASGTGPDEFLLDVLGAAMQSIGRRWEEGVYTVDDEHRASVVATRLVARLGARFSRRGPRRRTVILGAAPGELHGLPTAIAANVLRGRGYGVVDLGADVPADAFAAAVGKETNPLAVGIAVTVHARDRAVRDVVRAVAVVAPELPVLAGGRGIENAEHAAKLGARWSGLDATELAAVVDQIDRPRPG